jgi:hypothetical protein
MPLKQTIERARRTGGGASHPRPKRASSFANKSTKSARTSAVPDPLGERSPSDCPKHDDPGSSCRRRGEEVLPNGLGKMPNGPTRPVRASGKPGAAHASRAPCLKPLSANGAGYGGVIATRPDGLLTKDSRPKILGGAESGSHERTRNALGGSKDSRKNASAASTLLLKKVQYLSATDTSGNCAHWA